MKAEKDIFNALKRDAKGYWYYSVPTSVRRDGKMKVSEKKYQQLLLKYVK